MPLRFFSILCTLLCLFSIRGWAQPTAGFTITGLPNTTGPVPAANGSTIKICTGTTLILTDASAATSTPIKTVAYVYQNKTYPGSLGGNTAITFIASDTLKQEVTDYDGRKSTLKVYVSVSTTYPIASFIVSPLQPQCGYNDFTFTGNSAGSGLSYNWTFTGSSVTAGTGNPVKIKFDNATGNSTGNYPVTLSVTNSGGCSDDTTINVAVNQIPDVAVTSPNSALVLFNKKNVFSVCADTQDSLFLFNNKSSTETSNKNYHISWGDGTTDYDAAVWGTANVLSHRYARGYHTMKVSITGNNANSCTNTKEYGVFVGTNPAGGFGSGGNTTGFCVGDSLKIPLTSYEKNADGTLYVISINESPLYVDTIAQSQILKDPTYRHKFTQSSCPVADVKYPNQFTVHMDVVNPCGNTPFDQANILVSGKLTPLIDIGPSKNICIQTPVVLTNNTIWGGAYLNGKIPCDNTPGEQVWEISGGPFTLNPGEQLGSVNPWVPGSPMLHVQFSGVGIYKIKLYVRSDKSGTSGCAGTGETTEEEICVRNPPKAAFSLDNKTGCAPATIKAAKTSPEDAACTGESVAWTVKRLSTATCAGGGSYTFTDSTTKLAAIRFSEPGDYELMLAVSADNSGSSCNAVYRDTIRIGGKPGAVLEHNPAICVGDSVLPKAVIDSCFSVGVIKYKWTIAGAAIKHPDQADPGFITYLKAGTYKVQLTVSNDCGDSTVTDSVVVTGKPVLTAIKDTAVCSGNVIHLPLQSPGSGIVYSWLSNVTTGNVTGNTIGTDAASAFIDDALINTTSPPGPAQVQYRIWASAPGAICTSDTATIVVTVLPLDSAMAGADQFMCKGQTTTFLSAVPPKPGAVGVWTQLGSPAAVIVNPADPATPVTGLASGNAYTFIWTISNTGSVCVKDKDTVTVSLLPVINILNDAGAAICSGAAVTLTGPDVSGGNGVYTYRWQQSSDCIAFVDVAGQSDASLTITPAPNSCYRRIVQSGNCADTSNAVKIPVNTVVPVPSFRPVDTTGCGPLSITFTNTTAPTPEQFVYSWDFGTGETSKEVQPAPVNFPVNTYSYGDTLYKVIMKAGNGCVTVTADTGFIRVKSKPKASFTPDVSTGCSPQKILFTNNSAGSNVTYTWNFGDGSSKISGGSDTISHVYHTSVVAVFKVLLIAANECGSDTATINIVVNPNAIDLHMAVNGNQQFGCTGENVLFINNTTGANIFRWNFGDPSSGNDNTLVTENGIGTVSHTYNNVGNYTATVCAANGCTLDTCTAVAIAIKAKPAAAFTALPANACVDAAISITNNSTPNDGSLAYRWTFGDDSTSTAISPSHAYSTGGTYTMQLIASQLFEEGFTCADSAATTITVSGPTGELRYSDTLCAGREYSFEAISSNVPQYKFYFGDGDSLLTSNTIVTHTYRLPGNFVPSVLLMDGACSKLIQGIKPVYVDSVKAGFDYSISAVCNSTAYRFNNVSYAFSGISKYEWLIDGQAVNEENPSHNFTTSGTYNVTLRTTGTSGCFADAAGILEVYVHGTPSGSMASPNLSCARDSLPFTAEAFANDPVTSDWDFGNGYKVSGKEVTAVYGTPGNYIVTLVNRTDFGCKDTIYKTVAVQESPVVNAGSDITICRGNTTTLKATGAGVVTWNWSPVNDLSCADCTSPQAAPAVTTAYTITGTNSLGCSSKEEVIVQVIQPFAIAVTPGNTAICIGESVHLFASGAYRYVWSPPTWLNQSIIPDPMVTPPVSLPAPTQVTYQVTGYDAYNCFTDTKDITIMAGLIPTIELGPGDSGVAGRKVILHPVTANGPFKSFTWKVISGHGAVDCNGSPACAEPKFTIDGAVAFAVVAENIYGCTATDTIRYEAFCSNGEQVFIPNAFSPDGDGINDVFMVQGKGIMVESFRVYNRWGQVVFDAGSNFLPNGPARGWNGTINGDRAAIATEDVYVYVAKLKCTAANETFTKKGNVTLIRVRP